jgi:hypothetical protein
VRWARRHRGERSGSKAARQSGSDRKAETNDGGIMAARRQRRRRGGSSRRIYRGEMTSAWRGEG